MLTNLDQTYEQGENKLKLLMNDTQVQATRLQGLLSAST